MGPPLHLHAPSPPHAAPTFPPPQEDFTFSTISGATTELLLDLPDGEWSIVVKNDIFDKTSGSVHNYDMVRGDGPGGGLQPVWIWPRTWARGIADAQGDSSSAPLVCRLPTWSQGVHDAVPHHASSCGGVLLLSHELAAALILGLNRREGMRCCCLNVGDG